MSERTNEHAAAAVGLLGQFPQDAHPRVIEAAKVRALLALAEEVKALREQLADDLGPVGAIAGFLDEIAVRIAPDGDSIAEAVVGLRGGEDRD